MEQENHTQKEIVELLQKYVEPKKNKTISLRLNDKDYLELIELCSKLKTTPSRLIRDLLINQLKIWGKE